MDKRTLLALALMALVIVLTPRLFPSRRPAVSATDSTTTAATTTTGTTTGTTSVAKPAAGTQAAPTDSAPSAAAVQPPAVAHRDTAPRENVTLTTPRAEYLMVNPGAVPQAVRIESYKNLRPGHTNDVPG